MNPFEFQAQMFEAWADATRSMVTSALGMWSQSMGLPDPQSNARALMALPFASATSAAFPAWQMWSMPGLLQPSASPMSFAGWPFGSPFSAPFGSSFPSPFSFPAPFPSPFMPFQAMGWPSGATAWPMMVFFMPAPAQFTFDQSGGPWWLPGVFGGQFGRGSEMPGPHELLEQMATSYRTASGYAAAVVMGPSGTRLPPREDGVPFWRLPSDTPRRDLN